MKTYLFIIPLSLLFLLSGCEFFNKINISVDNQITESENLDPAAHNGLISVQTRERDGMTMVYVPEGQFKMGNDDREGCPNASPAHDVSLDAFWIDQVEVTNEMFTLFLNDQGNQSQNEIQWWEPGAGHRGIIYGYIEENEGEFITQVGYENFPVIEVSWYGAAAFCSWVGGRLPTEAEWEYAARGPSSNKFPWGDSFDGELVNYCDSSCQESWKVTDFNDGATKWLTVGNYPDGASWCGALDMAGNVWEWVNDWWSDDYYSISPTKNPSGPNNGTIHIARGGSWYDEWRRMDLSCRKGLSSSSARMHWVGFRCVIPAE